MRRSVRPGGACRGRLAQGGERRRRRGKGAAAGLRTAYACSLPPRRRPARQHERHTTNRSPRPRPLPPAIFRALVQLYHWSERVAWRIALLLPVWQKTATARWLRGFANATVGETVHHSMRIWACAFFVYPVAIHDVPHLVQWALGRAQTSVLEAGTGVAYSHELGYHGALVLMALSYGAMALPCSGMAPQLVVARPRPRPATPTTTPAGAGGGGSGKSVGLVRVSYT